MSAETPGPELDEAVAGDPGDIAADFIEGLLDICDLDGDIEIEDAGGRVLLSVGSAGDPGLRPLSTPEVVTALQDLTRLAVQARTGEPARLLLDVAGSRDQRSRELSVLVDEAAAALDAGAAEYALPAMSSYERKLVHDLVSARGLSSHSEGEGGARHTVITAE